MLDISVTGLLADALYFSHGGFLQVLCISVMGASCRCFVFQSWGLLAGALYFSHGASCRCFVFQSWGLLAGALYFSHGGFLQMLQPSTAFLNEVLSGFSFLQNWHCLGRQPV